MLARLYVASRGTIADQYSDMISDKVYSIVSRARLFREGTFGHYSIAGIPWPLPECWQCL